MKLCKYCGELREESRFYKGRLKCKTCLSKSNSQWNKRTKNSRADKIKDWQKAYYIKNKDSILSYNREWRKNNPEKLGKHGASPNERMKKWQKAHPEKVREANSKNWKRKKLATPKWANSFFVKEASVLARLRTELTGFRWEVDHIIPLNSLTVCGLHWEGNLQVIPALDNVRKGNKYDADNSGKY